MNDKGSTSVLRARKLRKDYGKDAGLVRAVDDVDLDVAPGETLAVMGPGGCGKSTLLHLLGGLDRPTAGEIVLYEAPKNDAGPATVVPIPWLAVTIAGTLLVAAVLTAIPTRISARRPAAEVLQAETR